MLVFGVSSAAAVSYTLQSNIRHVDVSALVPTISTTPSVANPSDPNAGQAVNILLLGSDERDGANADIGGEAGGKRSDTAIVLHISADRTRVEAVSIPRDSMVKIPSCTMSDLSTTKAQSSGMFNSAFATGWDHGGDMASAAACAINTVQVNTGVTINHFVVVDFAGFQKMIDTIGGVPICIPKDMSDDYTGLDLKAGLQTLDGTQALQFARARHVSGTDGSDITRIAHQQQLLAAVVQQVLSKNVLTNAGELIGFASAVSSSLTMDPGLSLSTLTGLAYGLKNISGANITFMTIPWTTAPTDKARVVWADGAADIWANMAADRPIVATETPAVTPTTPTPTGAATTAPPAPTTPAPATTKTAGKDAMSADDLTSSTTCAA
ncbi:MAG: LCP family protein [Actinobacteria bacterium]|nr:LCP family protein [Actinomycetota bacterium]